jgi:phage terminase large subunit-like protein
MENTTDTNTNQHPFSAYNDTKNDKIHAKQVSFHVCSARNRWVFGGNRTGKTECGAFEVVLWALCEARFGVQKTTGATEGWVVSLTRRVQRDVAQAKIFKYLPKDRIIDVVMLSGTKASPEYGIVDYILVRNNVGTISKIGFKTCDQGREQFQGVGLDYIWFDEEPPHDVYEECLLRTLERGGSIWATMTPLKGRSWVYDEIYLKSVPILVTNY